MTTSLHKPGMTGLSGLEESEMVVRSQKALGAHPVVHLMLP